MGILRKIGTTLLGGIIGALNEDKNSKKEFRNNPPEFDVDRWNKLIEKINNSLDNEQYEKADSQLGNYYKQYKLEKNFFYYWFRAYIIVRWLVSCPSMDDNQIQKWYKRASDCICQALKLAPDEDSRVQVEEIKEHYEEYKSMKSHRAFIDKIDQLCNESDFPQAEALLDNFYSKRQKDYDIPYFIIKIRCVLFRYDVISDEQDEPSIREQLNGLLLDYLSLCDNDESKEDFAVMKSKVQDMMAKKDIDRMTSSERYDEAIDVVEKFKFDCPDDTFNYFKLKRLVLQRKWRATSITDKNYARIEQDVIDAFKAWEDNCSSDNEKELCSACYNEAFVTIKKEKEDEKRMLPLSINSNSPSKFNDAESQYLKEVQFLLEEGEIGTSERKLLERKRTKLGLSEDQARRIEASCTIVLTNEEQEYAEIYKDLVEDGEPTGRLRKLLDREADSLGLSPEQVAKVEQMIK